MLEPRFMFIPFFFFQEITDDQSYVIDYTYIHFQHSSSTQSKLLECVNHSKSPWHENNCMVVYVALNVMFMALICQFVPVILSLTFAHLLIVVNMQLVISN